MLQAIRAHHDAGKPILAECGGMLYLLDALTDKQGASAEPSACCRAARACSRAWPRWPGRWSCRKGPCAGIPTTGPCWTVPCAAGPGRCPNGKPVAEAVYRLERLTASYIHFYLPSNWAAAELLLP